MKKIFSKSELIIITTVLLVVGIVSYFNMQVSLRRARDFQRKEDIVNLTTDIEFFKERWHFYPLSEEGRIMACANDNTVKDYKENHFSRTSLVPCNWYVDTFFNPEIPGEEKISYQPIIPGDPETGQGKSYFYLSTGEHFQMLAHLEGKDEPEYDKKIEERNIKCGNQICNFGRSSVRTPLDKSLEVYENELEAAREMERRNVKKK